MDMFTTDRTRSKSPPVKNSFQRELQAKMRERKKMGLSADLSDSANGSEDELGSENEFLSQFSMAKKDKKEASWAPPGTKKSPSSNRKSPFEADMRSSPHSGRSSPYGDVFAKKTSNKNRWNEDDDDDEEDDQGPSNLLMTMKKPWQPNSTMKKPMDGTKTTPSPMQRKSKALDALDELSGEKSPRLPYGQKSKGKENKPWAPPAYKKGGGGSPELSRKSPKAFMEDEEDDDDMMDRRKMRPKSPSVRGRKSPLLLDSIEEKEKPRPSPRFGKSATKDQDDHEESPRPKPRARAKGLFDDFASSNPAVEREKAKARVRSPSPTSKPRSKTPTTGIDKKRSTTPKNEFTGRKATTQDGRKTPTGKVAKETSPENQRKMSLLDMMANDTDTKSTKKKPKPHKSLLASSSDSEDDTRSALKKRGQASRSPEQNRKSPFLTDMRKGPSLEEERARRRGKSPLYAEEEDMTERRGGRLGMQKPSLRKTRAVEDEDSDEDERMGGRPSAFQPVPQARAKQREGRSRDRTPKDERDSSVCREVEKDPGPMRHAPTREAEELKKKQPKHQRKEKQLLDSAIDEVDGAQGAMSFIDPDKKGESKEAQDKRARTPKYKPQPRYAKPQLPDPDSARTVDFNSTTNIRDAVYQDWYAQKMERAKQELKEKKQKEKEAEDKIKKDKEDKIVEAKVSYQAWMEQKKEVLSAKERQKRKEEEKKRQKEVEDKVEKQKESEVTFRTWKENKDAVIRENERKKKREEEKKRRDEQDKKYEREKDSVSAFKGWKGKKDVVILKQTVEEKRKEKDKEQEKLREQRKRERESQKAYDKWMNRKEDYEYETKRHMQHSQAELDASRPAWSPASRTIPAGR